MNPPDRQFNRERRYFRNVSGPLVDEIFSSSTLGESLTIQSDDGGIPTGLIASLAKITVGYVGNILSKGWNTIRVQELVPNHDLLLRCFRHAEGAIRQRDKSVDGACQKAVIDRAYRALVSLQN